ncbi:MAG: hypothetical protein ABR549_09435 [Mycobacteriales bacterium]
MSRETWVRPPVVATEPASKKLALWRYRIVAALLLLIVVFLVAKLFLTFSDVTGGEDPGIGLSRPAPVQVTTAG